MEEKLLKIINKFGVNNQQRKLVEEVFELNEVITKHEALGCEYQHIVEEIADVMVILEQFKLYYGITSKEITDIFWNKVDRTLDRIEEGYYENERNKNNI